MYEILNAGRNGHTSVTCVTNGHNGMNMYEAYLTMSQPSKDNTIPSISPDIPISPCAPLQHWLENPSWIGNYKLALVQTAI
jgi:hypothetical protein